MLNITITDKETGGQTLNFDCNLIFGVALTFDKLNGGPEEYGAQCSSFMNGVSPITPMALGDPIGTGMVRVLHDACKNVGEEVVLLGRIKDIVTEAHKKAAMEMGSIYTGKAGEEET